MSVFEPLGETISRDGLESNEDVVRMRMLAVMLSMGLDIGGGCESMS